MGLETTIYPMTTEWLRNITNSSDSETIVPTKSPVTKHFKFIFLVVYAFGIVGNAAAIIALRRGERRIRNRKHLLLLTSLAANDLVALMGMMSAMIVGEYVPGASETQVFCAIRVVLRVFGIGSVCIAVTMALERYLALTRPFLYQKQVTYYVIRMALLVSWFWAAVLTCAPIFGLGLYYNEAQKKCIRYRNATTSVDFGYAVFYVIFGTLLCVILVYCNLAVIRALYAITAPRGGDEPIVRRVSKSSCRQRERSINSGNNLHLHHNAATAEEVAFSRLMATLSVLFMICWLPQMVTSALYLGLGPSYWRKLEVLGSFSDMLMLLNYVLDPILYVLMRQRTTIWQTIEHCFKRVYQTSRYLSLSSPSLLVAPLPTGINLKCCGLFPDMLMLLNYVLDPILYVLDEAADHDLADHRSLLQAESQDIDRIDDVEDFLLSSRDARRKRQFWRDAATQADSVLPIRPTSTR